MARAKAKAKGLPCPLETLKPLNLDLIPKQKDFLGDSLESRFDLITKTMVPGFKILLDCNKVPELKKEDTTWVPTDQADYMDLDAMTTLFGDHICNIKEKEYWEACQHTLKSTYELRANDGDGEGGTTLSDDDDGSEDKSNSSSDSRSNDSGHNDDDSNTNSDDNNRIYDSPYSGDDWGEPPSDREDEDADPFYKEYDDDVDYYG